MAINNQFCKPEHNMTNKRKETSALDYDSVNQTAAAADGDDHDGHDDVIKWKHFPRYFPFVRGIHRSPVNSPHKGQWRGVLMLYLICAGINGWVNNREAGDMRRHQAHNDVTVMVVAIIFLLLPLSSLLQHAFHGRFSSLLSSEACNGCPTQLYTTCIFTKNSLLVHISSWNIASQGRTRTSACKFFSSQLGTDDIIESYDLTWYVFLTYDHWSCFHTNTIQRMVQSRWNDVLQRQ